MKIAIVHDYIKEYGGAERVLETLHEIWPEAPVFTTVYLPQFLGPHRKRFEGWDIRTSFLQNIPFIGKLISPIRLLTPWVFENWNFEGFDAVIVSATGAYSPNLIVRKPNTIHFCYCHTPPRFLYGYPTARNWQNNVLGKIAGDLVNHRMREIDFISAQRPDFFIANSNEVRRRIEKYYRREATVIYPPVDTSSKLKAQSSNLQRKAKSYFLAGGRLARPKHIELAIEACNEMKLPLKVFGRGFADYGEELSKIAGPTIEFLGEVEEEYLHQLYRDGKALLYPSEQEDFGIIPVEAMSMGMPVIGLNQGGVKETVIDGKTGVLFNSLTIESIISAIKRFNTLTIKSEDCIKQAQKFSKERFKREMQVFIKSKLQN
ncbi:glycosyltransferase, partial [Candidatus Gottesmanbacteria bacterium]|nr:glycosyltransferase [Candidatus Gottesmanbacteria bacterium]